MAALPELVEPVRLVTVTLHPHDTFLPIKALPLRLSVDVLLDYSLPAPADVLLQVEAAAMADQRIVRERLTATSPEHLRAVEGEESVGQRTWAIGVERLTARYTATIDIDRAVPRLETLGAALARDLPGLVLPYLLPSRYVESHLFEAFVEREFGALQGGTKVSVAVVCPSEAPAA
jgi:hypothetical protein